MRSVLIAGVSAFVFAAGVSAQDEAAAEAPNFEDMCKVVSEADGVPEPAIGPFCACMAEHAAADEEVGAELAMAARDEPDADARLEMLSEPAREVVMTCRGPGPEGGSEEASPE